MRFASRAEAAGFTFALVSDHYHPWVDRQGQSPFVWGVIGGISQATRKLRLGTGVTCPMVRIHPAIIAQAAATAAAMMPGRFFLGVGTGENLNEHILGDRWPAPAVRLEMLEEAIEVIRLLWKGGYRSHSGRYYRVENARIFSLPEEPPPIIVAGVNPKAVDLAGRVGDGFVCFEPEREIVDRFEKAGGGGKPRYGQVTVCWAQTEKEARKIAWEWWPNGALGGDVAWELPLPRHFEQLIEMRGEDDLAEEIVCGPDVDRHLEAIERYFAAGYDHVYVHQVGPDQDGFFDFYENTVLPRL